MRRLGLLRACLPAGSSQPEVAEQFFHAPRFVGLATRQAALVPALPLLLIILPPDEGPGKLFDECEGDRFDSSAGNARIRPIG
jgi:hypothetical protein